MEFPQHLTRIVVLFSMHFSISLFMPASSHCFSVLVIPRAPAEDERRRTKEEWMRDIVQQKVGNICGVIHSNEQRVMLNLLSDFSFSNSPRNLLRHGVKWEPTKDLIQFNPGTQRTEENFTVPRSNKAQPVSSG